MRTRKAFKVKWKVFLIIFKVTENCLRPESTLLMPIADFLPVNIEREQFVTYLKKSRELILELVFQLWVETLSTHYVLVLESKKQIMMARAAELWLFFTDQLHTA